MKARLKQKCREFFTAGFKPESLHRMGCEYEKFGFLLKDSKPLPYFGEKSVYQILKTLSESYGWRAYREKETIVSLKKGDCFITLEPSGQVELSAAPFRKISSCEKSFQNHMDELIEVTKGWGVIWFAGGLVPHLKLEEMPLIPKQRYEIMDKYLQKRGRLSRHMMRMTQSIQTSLDFTDEQDAMEKLRISMALSPFVSAMFSNSPFFEGQLNGFHSNRQRIWLETDPERCGIIPGVVEGGFGIDDYIDYSFKVPMMFKKTWRGDEGYGWEGLEGHYFDQFALTLPEEKWLEAYTLHLTGVFTDVRLKTYVEIRNVDSVPEPWLHAVSALWKGLLYHKGTRKKALDFISTFSTLEVTQLRTEVAQFSLEAYFRGKKVVDWCLEIFKLAQEGLKSLGDEDPSLKEEENYIIPLGEFLQEGVNPSILWIREFNKGNLGTGGILNFFNYQKRELPAQSLAV